MLCDHCHINEANIQMRLTRNNETTDLNLCSSCAAQMQSGSGMIPSLFDSFFNQGWSGHDLIGTALFGSDTVRQTDHMPQVKACANCGQAYKDFRETGLLGCSHCYQTYRPWLEQVLKRVQRDTRHVGHRPGQVEELFATKATTSSPDISDTPAQTTEKGSAEIETHAEPAEQDDKITGLRSQLKQAVKIEDYQEAARLRDLIHELEDIDTGTDAETTDGTDTNKEKDAD